MTEFEKRESRRRFLRTGLALGAALPVVIGTARTAAAQMPKLEESDPAAKALRYVHDASTVDSGIRGSDDRLCSNCRFYTDEDAAEWGPCQLFPGKTVNANGWCAGWAARP